jgi:hypothetical protein
MYLVIPLRTSNETNRAILCYKLVQKPISPEREFHGFTAKLLCTMAIAECTDLGHIPLV